ncbi:hypothetical protein L7F22_055338 [Adiantum nelumboides]|nr:hypothetical protein [Adiantum nelumboides]
MASQEASDVSPSSPPSGSATASQAPPSAKFTWTWWDEVIAPKAGVGGGSKPWRCRRCAYERNASVQKLGDGGDGGGVKLSQTAWGEVALSIAKEVLEEFGDNFSLYAFKTSYDHSVYVRLDKHSDRYGSPTMVEIESFSSIYKRRLEEAGLDGTIPDNIALEVSSPGAERVVQVPDQLLRFKDLPMLVRYEEAQENESTKPSPVVKDSILQLATVETELGKSVWKLANVRVNRDQAVKGRGLTRKQKEWRLEVPFSSLRLVRLYMDI